MKILGIDTGTNSLGWAVVEKTGNEYTLLEHGSHIFQEGVQIEKGQESSRAADRTAHRSLRKRYYRIKLRKIRLLRVLSEAHLCPELSKEELAQWRLHKLYPNNEAFRLFQATDDDKGINPYAFRHRCLHETLNLNDPTEAYVLGRALYHLSQRRGFLSNRKDATVADEEDLRAPQSETGKVKVAIGELSDAMKQAGCAYLGDYFYQLYQKGERIRSHYTARKEHYEAEFYAICKQQNLDADLVARLYKAIFFQRPLRSQKHSVGKCVFEKDKAKCPTSHPAFEEYRRLCFVNNIRIQTPDDPKMRPLNPAERKKIADSNLFYRKSKPNFNFSDIADLLAGKKRWRYEKDPDTSRDNTLFGITLFNFRADTSVPTCVVTAGLREFFGADYENTLCAVYDKMETKKGLKTPEQVVDDVWHALFFFEDEAKLALWGQKHLQLDEAQSKRFAKIKMPSAYASLSLCALRKITPYLQRGIIYSHAVFYANLCEVVPEVFQNPEERALLEQSIGKTIESALEEGEKWEKRNKDEKKGTEKPRIDDFIQSFLVANYHVDTKHLNRLYHPSMIETYPQQQPNKDGLRLLGSPRTDTIRNPMAMRSLFRLREVINTLLREGIIDPMTEIHIEFARELNDANRRRAIQRYQRENETNRQKALQELKQYIAEPTETDILKYLLWEEQGKVCPYTNHQIGITDFLGANPRFDIEHTIPQSMEGPSTRVNNTLCDSKFNREIKKAQLPSELPAEYKANFQYFLDKCNNECEAWKRKIQGCRTNGSMDKPTKDRILQNRHYYTLQYNYWKDKATTFTIKTEDVTGFSRRQGTDISVISKTALAYLKSVFPFVYTRKGLSTADFRKAWGLQEEYTKKERTNHIHHCIDAIVLACMGQQEYNLLAQFYRDTDAQEFGLSHTAPKPHFPKPWPSFVEDVKEIANSTLIAHYTADNVRKSARHKVRVNGQIVKQKGQTLYQNADSARGSLHKDTYYGAIQPTGTEQVRYVVRKPLNSLTDADVKNIVDPTVRAIVQAALEVDGDALKNSLLPGHEIWMSQAKQVPIKKVRVYTPTVTNPLHIREQRDVSVHPYKRQYHVVTDGNYLMAVYKGTNAKGKPDREFQLINLLEATRICKHSQQGDRLLVPEHSAKGYELAFILKTGTMVLLYENSPEEIWSAPLTERAKRLYKVTILFADGRVVFRHHQEARPATQLVEKGGAFKAGEERRPLIKLSCSSMNFLVENIDFKLNALGEITRLR